METRHHPARQAALKIAHFGALALFALFAALPFLWMLITAFKQDPDLYNRTNNPFIFNMAPTLAHLKELFNETLFAKWLLNTAFVGVAVVLITLVLAIPAAYSLVRLAGRWGEKLGIGIFLTYLVAPTILFIPMSRIVAKLGLQDSLWSLVVVFPSFTVPFAIWLLMGFFKAIPPDLEEAAMIDGYSRFGAFVRMVIPISTSGILTVVIFSFTLVIQEYIYTLTFVTTASQYTVSVGVPTFLVRGDVYNWGALMAGCLIASVPVVIIYNFFIERFIRGLTLGAVKG
ncbi:MAG: carbohydrate ABC transporter permease [Desulfobacteraceae bacterium]|nr:MAG: carbohydrate ABC transporter permease [Desulfobacteraceae bacterium]